MSPGQEAGYLVSRKKAHVVVMQVSYSFLWHIYRVFENLYRNLGSNYLYFSRKGPEGNSSAQYWLYVIGAMASKIQTMKQQTRRPVIHTAEELVLNPKFSPPACPIGLLYCNAHEWQDVYVSFVANVALLVSAKSIAMTS